MEIPLFMPDLALQASISSTHDGWGCGLWAQSEPWTQTLCRMVRVDHRLRQSSFFRHPHVQRFASAVDLVHQLAVLDCRSLGRLSQKIHAWNMMLLEDDMNFWRSSIRALAQVSPERQRTRPLPIKAAGTNTLSLNFALPGSTSQNDAPCSLAAAAHCGAMADSPEFPRQVCCREAAVVTARVFAARTARAESAPKPECAGQTCRKPPERCIEDPEFCHEDQLLYATHLLHSWPPLRETTKDAHAELKLEGLEADEI